MPGVRAVVFDIGGVLERVDDVDPPLGTTGECLEGRVLEHLAEHAPDEDVVTGRMSWDDIRRAYADALGLQEEQADAMMAEMWDAYCGELDVPISSSSTTRSVTSRRPVAMGGRRCCTGLDP